VTALQLTEHASPDRTARRIALIYLILTAGWIYFSDRVLEFCIADPAHLSAWQTGKGWLFVLCSALLIYFLVSRALQGQKAAMEEAARTLYALRQREAVEANIRAVNNDLQRQTALLEAANKEMEAFSYSVSHDLRAPLRAVNGFTRILLEEHAPQLDAEGRRVCDIIGENTRRMGQLIDDLLALTRVGRVPLNVGAVDVAALARTIYFEITTPRQRERIDFSIEPLPATCADPTLLRQALSNLLANAVKFSAKKERAIIRLSAAGEGGEVVYALTDNGAGFDMRYVDKLFGMFQRLHSVQEFDGTGVGLAIVRRVIGRHGGRVWAEGAPEGGATFYFALQQEEADDARPQSN